MKKTKDDVTCSCRLPKDLYRVFIPLLRSQGRTFSGFVRIMAKRYINDFKSGSDLTIYSSEVPDDLLTRK